MNISNASVKMAIALVALAVLSLVLPVEFLVSAVLFALITYGCVSLIKNAIMRNLEDG